MKTVWKMFSQKNVDTNFPKSVLKLYFENVFNITE